MVKFVKTESTDQRLFVFQEKHISGGEATVLITGAQIVDYMREWSANPFGSIHSDWIDEFCKEHNAELVDLPESVGEAIKKLEDKNV